MAKEFDFIKQFFSQMCTGFGADEIGIGDDGAVVSIPCYQKGLEQQMVVVTDTMVQGIHFPEETSAFDIGWKALAVNLSDLAAMGARPWCYSLALSVPPSCSNEAWFAEFTDGLKALCRELKITIPLIGGDTTSAKEGALSVTVCANGLVNAGGSISRSQAKEGDVIVVTNQLGEGALGLKVAFGEPSVLACLDEAQQADALQALNKPLPMTDFGKSMHNLVHSAIDVSDGLLQDLQHILKMSAVHAFNQNAPASSSLPAPAMPISFGADLFLDQMPISSGARAYIEQTGDWSMVVSGGDDFQLCLTMDESCWESLQVLAGELGISVSQIGRVTSEPEIVLYASKHAQQGVQAEVYQRVDLSASSEQIALGFQHF